MKIDIQSFGFKRGIPEDAHLVIDVRFLANPHHVPELKILDGESEPVGNYVLNNDDARAFLRRWLDLLQCVLPLYEKEGRERLTIAVGCIGGRHRSVAAAREIHARLTEAGRSARVIHRDLDRPRAAGETRQPRNK